MCKRYINCKQRKNLTDKHIIENAIKHKEELYKKHDLLELESTSTKLLCNKIDHCS